MGGLPVAFLDIANSSKSRSRAAICERRTVQYVYVKSLINLAKINRLLSYRTTVYRNLLVSHHRFVDVKFGNSFLCGNAMRLISPKNCLQLFSRIKSASASIAFFHKINLFTNHPTGAPEVCMMRTTTARKIGLSPKRVKESFLWLNLVDFALLYGIHSQGYCHLIEATLAILSFGAMCRYI